MKLKLLDVYDPIGSVPHYNAVTFLYQMLKERDPTTAISHEKMPAFAEHHEFVTSRPYIWWFLIEDEEEKKLVGHIYLSKRNEIAVYIKAGYRDKGIATWATNELMRMHGPDRYFMNIHPKNDLADQLRMSLGFNKLIQETYELDTRPPSE